jgi:hypothetical protein
MTAVVALKAGVVAAVLSALAVLLAIYGVGMAVAWRKDALVLTLTVLKGLSSRQQRGKPLQYFWRGSRVAQDADQAVLLVVDARANQIESVLPVAAALPADTPRCGR